MIETLNFISKYTIPLMLVFIVVYALTKNVEVYGVFAEGAKQGLRTTIMIVPYLVCMFCAIGMFRASGIMEWLVFSINHAASLIGLSEEVLHMGIVSAVLGSSETTFYVIAVYFGSVGIVNVRYAVFSGIVGDLVSLVTATMMVNLFWY